MALGRLLELVNPIAIRMAKNNLKVHGIGAQFRIDTGPCGNKLPGKK
jgi:hypothetical protein